MTWFKHTLNYSPVGEEP